MKRITYLKTLLVGLCAMGATSAWADGNKRVLNSQNYETATASDWTSNGNSNFPSDETHGNYANVGNGNASGNRSCYKSVTFDNELGTGYTTAAMETLGYVIEFDMLMSGGNVNDRSEQQFIIPTTGPDLANNAYYSGSDFIST